MKITVKHNGKVMAIESADPAAGVPDTTQGAGPDLIKLQDDAKKDPKDPQAEFDANAQKLTDGEAELENGRQEILDGEKEIKENEQKCRLTYKVKTAFLCGYESRS